MLLCHSRVCILYKYVCACEICRLKCRPIGDNGFGRLCLCSICSGIFRASIFSRLSSAMMGETITLRSFIYCKFELSKKRNGSISFNVNTQYRSDRRIYNLRLSSRLIISIFCAILSTISSTSTIRIGNSPLLTGHHLSPMHNGTSPRKRPSVPLAV